MGFVQLCIQLDLALYFLNRSYILIKYLKQMTTKNTNAIAKRPQPKKELELLEVELKRIEVQERLRGMEHNQFFRPKSEEDRLNLEKISTLNFLLTSAVIDNERTLIGSEPVYRAVYADFEEEIIRHKVLEIVARL
jgi:hypothetical protein